MSLLAYDKVVWGVNAKNNGYVTLSAEIWLICIFRTFEYVRRELLRVPHSVPVLVVGNYRDIAAGGNLGGREMSESDARAFIRRATEARQAASAGVTPSDNINISDIRNMYKYVRNAYYFIRFSESI